MMSSARGRKTYKVEMITNLHAVMNRRDYNQNFLRPATQNFNFDEALELFTFLLLYSIISYEKEKFGMSIICNHLSPLFGTAEGTCSNIINTTVIASLAGTAIYVLICRPNTIRDLFEKISAFSSAPSSTQLSVRKFKKKINGDKESFTRLKLAKTPEEVKNLIRLGANVNAKNYETSSKRPPPPFKELEVFNEIQISTALDYFMYSSKLKNAEEICITLLEKGASCKSSGNTWRLLGDAIEKNYLILAEKPAIPTEHFLEAEKIFLS